MLFAVKCIQKYPVISYCECAIVKTWVQLSSLSSFPLSMHLFPWQTSVFGGLFRGNWSCTALRWYKCPPASSISSLFSVLMLQWSSSALSTVTPKQLLDSFTFNVTRQTHWAQNICHRLILIDVGLCSKQFVCKIAHIQYSFWIVSLLTSI